MSPTLFRTRFGAAVAAAFIGGVLVASSLDFTHFGYAQGADSGRNIEILGRLQF